MRYDYLQSILEPAAAIEASDVRALGLVGSIHIPTTLASTMSLESMLSIISGCETDSS